MFAFWLSCNTLRYVRFSLSRSEATFGLKMSVVWSLDMDLSSSSHRLNSARSFNTDAPIATSAFSARVPASDSSLLFGLKNERTNSIFPFRKVGKQNTKTIRWGKENKLSPWQGGGRGEPLRRGDDGRTRRRRERPCAADRAEHPPEGAQGLSPARDLLGWRRRTKRFANLL